MQQARVHDDFADLRLQYLCLVLASLLGAKKVGADGTAGGWELADFAPPWRPEWRHHTTAPRGTRASTQEQPAIVDLPPEFAALLSDPDVALLDLEWGRDQSMTPEQTRSYLATFFGVYGGHDPGDPAE